jgi:hypothetical protein
MYFADGYLKLYFFIENVGIHNFIIFSCLLRVKDKGIVLQHLPSGKYFNYGLKPTQLNGSSYVYARW